MFIALKTAATLTIGSLLISTGAFAQDSTSDADRIYGVHERSRMQSSAPLPAERKMTPEDGARIQKFNEERLTLPSNEAELGARFASNPVLAALGTDSPDLFYVLYWNDVALDVVSIDHTNTALTSLGSQYYAEQFGPPRASRALAIVHLAMFEAADALTKEFNSFKKDPVTTLQTAILAKINADPARQGRSSAQSVATSSDVAPSRTSLLAAISFAAHDALAKLYPAKLPLLDAALEKSLATVSPQDPLASSLGKSVGQAAAAVVLDYRSNDHSNDVGENAACTGRTNSLCKEPRFPAGMARLSALEFQPDDVSRASLKLGGIWGRVTLFEPSNSTILQKTAAGDHFLDIGGGVHLAPPEPGAPAFEDALDGPASGNVPDPHGSGQVRARYGVWQYGGSGLVAGQAAGTNLPAGPLEGPSFAIPTLRTPTILSRGGANDPTKQQFQASFWGYDGTALLCAPPRLYNMIAVSYPFEPAFVHQRISAVDDVTKMARYLALLNLALADAGIVSWNAKYSFNRARPIDYIRYGVPTKKVLIGGVETSGSQWTPLGQVASNFSAQNVTPPFPSYPSGHAVFGGAAFGVIRAVFHIDAANDTPFHFVSDEYNGKNVGTDGVLRSNVPVEFKSLSSAEWENAESRVWLGIHFQFDADDGTKVGNRIASNLVTEQLGAVAP